LIGSPGLRTLMGQAGRRRYEAEFTLDTMIRKTWDIYQQAAGSTTYAEGSNISLEVSRS